MDFSRPQSRIPFRLPLELLREICFHLTSHQSEVHYSTILSLLLCNKTCFEFCKPLLYRHLFLQQGNQRIERLYEATRINPSSFLLVRRISIEFCRSEILEEFREWIHKILLASKNFQVVSLSFYTKYAPILDEGTWCAICSKTLKGLQICGFVYDQHLNYLINQDSLEHLYLSSRKREEMPNASVLTVVFPNLRRLNLEDSSIFFASDLLKCCPRLEVFSWIHSEDQPPLDSNQMVQVFRLIPNLQYLALLVFQQPIDVDTDQLLRGILELCPNLRALRASGWMLRSSYTSHINQGLSFLRPLRQLSIIIDEELPLDNFLTLLVLREILFPQLKLLELIDFETSWNRLTLEACSTICQNSGIEFHSRNELEDSDGFTSLAPKWF